MQGTILTANMAFLGMAGLVTEEQARGETLDRWVGRNGVELDVLMSNLRQRGSVRFFTTSVRSDDGSLSQVEISAVGVGSGGASSFGFAIRNIGPRMMVEPARVPTAAVPRSLEQLTELIGRVSLKELVRESTDVIEKMCIEAALQLANDNRASAAEMLGLSRQSSVCQAAPLWAGRLEFGRGELIAMSASLAASNSVPKMRAPRTGVWAALELLKPITWFAPMWAFGCGLVSSGRPFRS